MTKNDEPDDQECADCYHDISQHAPDCLACIDEGEECLEFVGSE